MQDVIALYEQSLARRGFVSDSSQWRAVERLQQLYEEWTAYKARRNSSLKRLLVRPALPKGVYLWGAVGRGKSFLMDSFYLCVPLVRKRRVHFHHFMREIHRELDALKGTEDPIAALAERTARRCRLICFDEFHVSDIADAMILGRYLAQVMERGVVFCMTSNYHPDRLYEDGLQRDRFLPAIELIKSRLDVVEVDGGLDYRRRKMERLKVYHAGAGSEAELERIFSDLRDVEEETHPLDVEGRSIAYRRRAGGLVFDPRRGCHRRAPRARRTRVRIGGLPLAGRCDDRFRSSRRAARPLCSDRATAPDRRSAARPIPPIRRGSSDASHRSRPGSVGLGCLRLDSDRGMAMVEA